MVGRPAVPGQDAKRKTRPLRPWQLVVEASRSIQEGKDFCGASQQLFPIPCGATHKSVSSNSSSISRTSWYQSAAVTLSFRVSLAHTQSLGLL